MLRLAVRQTKLVAPTRGRRCLSTSGSTLPLSNKEFRKFPLISRKPSGSGNAFVFTFATSGAVVPPGRHILARAHQANGDIIQQPYTPVSSSNASNIELLVRLYADGKMSNALSSMKEGDTLELLGPVGSYEFKPNTNDEVLMVAGGSGITPFYAILNYIFRTNPQDDRSTKFELLYANKLPENILLRKELDALAAEFPDRFKVFYVVDEIPTGYQSDSSLRLLKNWRSTMAQFPGRKPSKNSQILVCGPPVMETAVAQLFRESGVDDRRIRTFTKAGMAEPNPVPIVVNKKYTMEEVAKHSSPEDAWTVIGGKVYDITKFISEHPGGDIIMDGVGKDATELFLEEFSHSDDAKKLLASFQIGFLQQQS